MKLPTIKDLFRSGPVLVLVSTVLILLGVTTGLMMLELFLAIVRGITG